METTGITVSCNRKQFTVTNGDCSWELCFFVVLVFCFFFWYLKLAPEILLRKKSVNLASDENAQLGQDGLSNSSLLNLAFFVQPFEDCILLL